MKKKAGKTKPIKKLDSDSSGSDDSEINFPDLSELSTTSKKLNMTLHYHGTKVYRSQDEDYYELKKAEIAKNKDLFSTAFRKDNCNGILDYSSVREYEVSSMAEVIKFQRLNDKSLKLEQKNLKYHDEVTNPLDFATSFKFDQFSTYVENHKIAPKKNIKDEFYRQSKIANLVNYDSDNDTTPTIKKSWGEIDFEKINPILKNILSSGELPKKVKIGEIEKAKEIISLLFISETSRNPATFLSSLMFLELLAEGELSIEDDISSFPMYLKGAVNASRELHNVYYNELKFKYDYSKGDAKLSENLKTLENDLFKRWLEFKEIEMYSGKGKNKKWNKDEINDALNELITDWYDIDLKGLEEYNEIKPIDYIDPYFGKYTLDALDDILHLRINDLKLKDVKILQSIFINQDYNNISDTLVQILASTVKTTLVPLNLFNKHAVGLIFEKNENNIIQVKYLDPLNKSIPQELKQIMIANLGTKTNFQHIAVEQQKYANCGSEVIENFIFYLTGNRVSQEKAIELHSKLVENALLSIKSFGIHLLFEELADNQNYTEDYLAPNKYLDNQFYNFDYDDNPRLEVAGEVTSLH